MFTAKEEKMAEGMIERVAFAMWAKTSQYAEEYQRAVWDGTVDEETGNPWGLPDADDDLESSPAGYLSPHGRDFYRTLARAAIEAMRDIKPTKEMMEAMWSLSFSNTAESFQTCWQAIIDAALKRRPKATGDEPKP